MAQVLADEPVVGAGLRRVRPQVLGQAAVVWPQPVGTGQQVAAALQRRRDGCRVGGQHGGDLVDGEAAVAGTTQHRERLPRHRVRVADRRQRLVVERAEARGRPVSPRPGLAREVPGQPGVQVAACGGVGDGGAAVPGQPRGGVEVLPHIVDAGGTVLDEVEPDVRVQPREVRAGPYGEQQPQSGDPGRQPVGEQFDQRAGGVRGGRLVQPVDDHDDVALRRTGPAVTGRQHLERHQQRRVVGGRRVGVVEDGLDGPLGGTVVVAPLATLYRLVAGHGTHQLAGDPRERPDRVDRRRHVRLAPVYRVEAHPVGGRDLPGGEGVDERRLARSGRTRHDEHRGVRLRPVDNPRDRPAAPDKAFGVRPLHHIVPQLPPARWDRRRLCTASRPLYPATHASGSFHGPSLSQVTLDREDRCRHGVARNS